VLVVGVITIDEVVAPVFQEYVLAPVAESVLVPEPQISVLPVTESVGEGATVVGLIEGAEVPQEKVAVTVTLPEVEDGITEIVFDVPEPVQPLGKDQLYAVTPVTGVTEKIWVLPAQMFAAFCTLGVNTETVVVVVKGVNK
jgi:hypothetical protein